jgi:CRISPR type III-B/RAMP module-associated protein Cmr5|tara:strand:- start:2395 stop:2832 length:438 start_codon:yes stop_codon:yes gene_type:complete
MIDIDHRRAAFALARVDKIEGEKDAPAKKARACKAIAMIKSSGLLKTIHFIKSKPDLSDIYADLTEWFNEVGNDRGPQLPEEIKEGVTTNGLARYLVNLESQSNYLMILQESIAFLGWIKLMAEGHKNQQEALTAEHEEGEASDD